jgi:uncharacterized protein YqgV (UPF0045/DUF77 family)
LETFQKIKHQLDELMARKTNIDIDYRPDFKAMIENPISKWDQEATTAIELNTNALLVSFQSTKEDIKKATDSVKIDFEIDRNTKKS